MLSLDAARRGRPRWPRPSAGRPSARDTTVVDPLSRRVDHGAVPSRPRDPLNPRLFGRRAFLRGALAATLAGPSLTGCATPARPEVAGRDPFSLGVASGEPTPDGFVLWTRLAPVPLWSDPAAPGGLVGGDVTLTYEIAADPGMRTIVQSGPAVAEAAYAYSVHLEVKGLAAERPYWYRFTHGDARSRIGRAWTGPEPRTALRRLRFAFVSCANYEHGFFSAYRHLADEEPDLVLFLRSAVQGAGARDVGRPRGPERLRLGVVGDVRRSGEPSRGGPQPTRPSTHMPLRPSRSARATWWSSRRSRATVPSPPRPWRRNSSGVSSIGPSYSHLGLAARQPARALLREPPARLRLRRAHAERLTAHLRTVSDVSDPRATLSTLRSFVVESDGRALVPA